MLENTPLIESFDSDEENNNNEPQKRKEPPVDSSNDNSKRRKMYGGQDPGPKGNPNCFNCGDSGHMSRDCIKPRPYEQGCVTCNSRAHASKFCPKRIEQLEHDRAVLMQMQAYGYGPTGYPTPFGSFDPSSSYMNESQQCLKCGKTGHKERECYAGQKDFVKCYNCNSKGHFAKDCTKGPMPQTCFNCGETGHMGKECTRTGRVCFICKGSGHVSKQCPSLPTRTCYNCGEEGHIGKACPKPANDSQVCFKCRQPGHKAIDCPQQLITSNPYVNYTQPQQQYPRDQREQRGFARINESTY
jgi:cellular nucleic acid-binding protein